MTKLTFFKKIFIVLTILIFSILLIKLTTIKNNDIVLINFKTKKKTSYLVKANTNTNRNTIEIYDTYSKNKILEIRTIKDICDTSLNNNNVLVLVKNKNGCNLAANISINRSKILNTRVFSDYNDKAKIQNYKKSFVIFDKKSFNILSTNLTDSYKLSLKKDKLFQDYEIIKPILNANSFSVLVKYGKSKKILNLKKDNMTELKIISDQILDN